MAQRGKTPQPEAHADLKTLACFRGWHWHSAFAKLPDDLYNYFCIIGTSEEVGEFEHQDGQHFRRRSQ